MKVAHIIDSGGLYGAEHMLLSLCKAQIQSGLDVLVISIGNVGEQSKPLEIKLAEENINYIPWRMRPLPNPLQSLKIIHACKIAAIDVIHSHGYKGNILLGMLPGFLRKIPVVSTVHGYTAYQRFSKLWLNYLLDRFFIGFLNAVVVVSPTVKEQLSLRRLKEKLHIICNGIAESVSVADAYQSVFCADHFKIGAVGRLSAEKNFELLIRAAPKILETIPDAQFIIHGEGAQKNYLLQLIKEFKLERSVFLKGYTSAPDQFLAELDVFINCSLTEGMPISILEAMRARTLVVASNIPANNYLLKSCVDSECLFDFTTSSLANSVVAVYRMDSQRKVSMLDMCEQEFKNKYTLEKMKDAYVALYSLVLNRK